MWKNMKKIPKSFKLRPDLLDRLDKVRRSMEVAPSETALVERAIEDFVVRHERDDPPKRKRAA